MFSKIFYLGTPLFAAQILSDLLEKNFKILNVITMPDKPKGRGYQLCPTEVKVVAQANSIPVFQPTNVDELRIFLAQEEPDLLIVVAYGMIFPRDLVDKYFFVNIHASILPKYRGSSPIQAPLLNGDKETGVTLMRIGHKVDDGDIIGQKVVPIVESDDLASVSDKLMKAGVMVLAEQLVKPLAQWQFLKQEEEKATFTKKVTKEDGLVDIAKDSTIDIIRKIKAYTPWPGVFTYKEGKRVKIIEAEINNGHFLIKKVQVEGKGIISYKEFVNSYGFL